MGLPASLDPQKKCEGQGYALEGAVAGPARFWHRHFNALASWHRYFSECDLQATQHYPCLIGSKQAAHMAILAISQD